ncbi:MAG: hypothetical protein MI810_01655 [Flavobacteriales bacterium]|nr:hypothetical protein [Flavobacteriales bacterium]
MKITKTIIVSFLFFIPFVNSCSSDSEGSSERQESKESDLLSDIQKAVDNYFSVKDENEFLRSTFTGDYNEVYFGHVYEFVITKKTDSGGEFNYLVQVTYDESTKSINVVHQDFFALSTAENVDEWVDKRKKLNEAKKVE